MFDCFLKPLTASKKKLKSLLIITSIGFFSCFLITSSQVSLNEGAHQLRLYSQGPNGVDPLTESCLRDGGVRIVPCATLLLRIVKVSRGPNGKALEVSLG